MMRKIVRNKYEWLPRGLVGIVILAATQTAFGSPAFRSQFDSLSPDKQSAIQKGELVADFSIQKEWPLSKIYQWIPVDAEDAAAIFLDYSRESEYVHGIEKSDVLKEMSPTSAIVQYALKLDSFMRFFFQNGNYVLFQSVTLNEGDFLFTSKYLSPQSALQMLGDQGNGKSTSDLDGGMIKDLDAEIYFEPHQGGTLIVYVNHTVLDHRLIANLLTQGTVLQSLKQGSKDALASIAVHIVKEVKEHPDEVQQRVQHLRKVLNY